MNRLASSNSGSVRRGIRLLGVPIGLLCLATGCLSLRLPQEELPAAPIAFVHWEGIAGTKRSEAFAEADELPRPAHPDDEERFEEELIRGHLRGDESPMLRSKLGKYPGRLMLVWPRTGVLERVEAAPLDSIPLAWSPDRKRLLIASDHRNDGEQLYEYDLERKDLSRLTTGPAEHTRADYFSDGRLIVQRIERRGRRGRGDNSAYIASAGGQIEARKFEEIPPGPVRAFRDGSAIVYEQVRPRPRRNGPTVFESFIATRSLAAGASPEAILLRGREPVITPDGEWIVFASESSAGYRLRRMRPDGTSRVPIGPGGTEERMPAVSPDGQFVAFVQLAGGRRRLVVRRFDGKDERVVLRTGWSEFPVW